MSMLARSLQCREEVVVVTSVRLKEAQSQKFNFKRNVHFFVDLFLLSQIYTFLPLRRIQ